VFRSNFSNFTENGSPLVLIDIRPTLSLSGQTVSIGLRWFQLTPFTSPAQKTPPGFPLPSVNG
jgi:hypothetical protein